MPKRKDGKFIKQTDPFHMIVPYIMPKRTEAEVSMKEDFDVTKVMAYIEQYNKKNDSGLKFFHCFCYIIAKTIYHRPKMNYFIKGDYFWERNEISLSFVAKQRFEDHAEERLMYMITKPEWTVADVSKHIIGDVKKAREAGANDLDSLMNFVGKLPRFVIKFVVWVLNTLDYYGHMPAAISKGDPNFSTCLISNLGSIKANSCYHHLSNYGTNSFMVTLGTIKTENGKSTVDVTFNLDERIADGFYFAKSLRYAKYLMDNPEMMEQAIKEEFPEGII